MLLCYTLLLSSSISSRARSARHAEISQDLEDLMKTSLSSSPLARLLPFLLIIAPAMVLLFGQLRALGVWEPWEAREILVAMEYQARPAFDPAIFEQNPSASGYNWAVPTLDGKPIAHSLLKTWLVGAMLPEATDDVRQVVGKLEQSARFPFALMMLSLLVATFVWLKKRTSTIQAAAAAGALMSMPVIYLGAHNLATPLLFIVTTSGALIALFELTQKHTSRSSWLLSAALATCLVLGVLDQRLVSLMLVLAVFAGYAILELPFHDKKAALPGKKDIFAAIALFPLLPALVFAYLYLTADSYASLVTTLSQPFASQIMMLLLPSTSILAALVLTRKTSATRATLRPQIALPFLLAIALVIFLGYTYAEVNPTLLKRGEIFSEIPSLGFLLGNDVSMESLARKHYRLDLWFRQVGFATFPWAALIPAGLAHLARNLRSPSLDLDEDDATERDIEEAELPSLPTPVAASLQRFLLAWAFIALFFMAAASTQNHYFYPALLPLAAACGLLLGDIPFWRFVRRARPIYPYLVAMTAVAIILMLGKDLERYPHRFIEVYAEMPQKLELPEGFSWGKTYKPMKYVMLLTIIASFFGPLSWFILQLESLDSFKERWRAFRKKESPLFAPITPKDSSPLEERAHTRVALLEGDITPKSKLATPLVHLAQLIERPSPRALLVTLMFIAFGILTLFSHIHQATYHLSQRHIFESYLESSDSDEKLVTYQTPKASNSLYLRDVPSLESTREFIDRVKSEDRFYAVVPRNKLATLNMYTRQQLQQNLHVLNAQSDKLVLVSNQIEEGEEDQNFIAKHIIEPTDTLPAEIQHPVTYKATEEGEERVTATFDDQLEFLGYSLNKKGARGGKNAPLYRWGDSIELTLYFRVKQRVPANQQFFVHIDTQGNRLHGDHYPLNGDFPTNTWLPGDIIKDTHAIPVESYSKVGQYSLNFGFYTGSKRMSIEPKRAQRDNRIKIGEIRVSR